MPLQPGKSKKVVGKNIEEMQASGHPHDQAVAASLHNADQYSEGGAVTFPRREKSGPGLTTAPKKFAEGGAVVTDQSNGDEFMQEENQGFKQGINGDMDAMKQAVADFVDKIHGNYIQGMGDTGNLKGLQGVMNGLTGDTTGPMPIDTSDGKFMGEIDVNVPAQKMADGGFATGDEDLPEVPQASSLLNEAATDPSDAFASLLRGGNPYQPKSALTQIPTQIGPGNAGTGADYLNGRASEVLAKNSTPTFNPKVGLPPTPPTVSPVAMLPTPQGYTPTANPAIGAANNYINQQKSAYNQYGPEQQLALQQALAQKYGGLQGKGAVALGGLADALMQGVARAGNPDFMGKIQGAQQADIGRQTEALKESRTSNIQNVEEGQKLDAQNPKSALSKLTQDSYKPLMSRLGYHELSGMSAAQIETVSKVAAEFGGKEMERLWQQARLAVEQNMKHQEMKLGAAKDIATEGIGTKIMNAIPGTAGNSAQKQLEDTAGISEGQKPMYAQNAGGHMITSADGGKTWTPIQ